jgi:predicted transcriptional regulator
MSGTVPITIRVSPELRKRLVALAKADKRPLSSFVAIQLDEVADRLEHIAAERAKPAGARK